MFHHGFTGREEAQELSGTRSFYALLHTLQEPRAQLSGKQVWLCLPTMSALHPYNHVVVKAADVASVNLSDNVKLARCLVDARYTTK